MRNCSANIDIERSVAVQCFYAGDKLPHEIHRAARQTQFRIHWSLVGEFSFMRDFWNIDWEGRGQLEWLNFRLLQFSGDRQLLPFRLRAQIQTRRLDLR